MAIVSLFALQISFGQQKPKVVVAYVTAGSNVMPDPALITHINYAFGHVNKTFNGIRIEDTARLRTISGLKNKKKDLKVLLSIGGWESGGFSEMAADEKNRKAFAEDCARAVSHFNLDGIDMDWEYPSSSAAGISSSPNDTINITLLMKDIRLAIGNKKLLTMASVDNARYVNFRALLKVLDFVNIMTYDNANPPNHHAPLYRSSLTRYMSGEEAVAAHIKAGLPPEQIVFGIPFYGRGNKKEISQWILYKDILKLSGYTSKWDDVAKAPYLLNKKGEFVCSYEDPKSIGYKCAFIKEKGLLGAMFWEYAGDTDEGVLRKALHQGLFDN